MAENGKGEKKVNFIRPQIYFTKKDEIEKLEDDFGKSKAKSVSDYLRNLIMLGYQTKMKEDSVSINSELRRIRMEMESLKQDLHLTTACVSALYRPVDKESE